MPAVIFRIWLKDDTNIRVFDQRVVDCCQVLKNMLDSNLNFKQPIDVKIAQFGAKNVRFVFKKAVIYEEHLMNFKNTKYFKECGRLDNKDLVEIMEIANFLDCQSVLKAVGLVVGGLLEGQNADTVAKILGIEEDMTEEERNEVQDRTNWYLINII